jgi:preprotein translocase subunit YajC
VNIFNCIAMAPQGEGGGGLMSTVVMFGLIIFIFYFMIIRPQSKKHKEREKMLSAVKKGDKVITIGGMHGTVVGLEEKSVLIQIAENVKVKHEKTAISTIVENSGTETK